MFNKKKEKTMKKKNESGLIRKFRDCDFKDAAEAIKGAKESKSLRHAELVENLVSQLKGKDIQAAVEIFSVVGILLDAKELAAAIEALKLIINDKIARKLLRKAEKGEVAQGDVMEALILSAAMEKD